MSLQLCRNISSSCLFSPLSVARNEGSSLLGHRYLGASISPAHHGWDCADDAHFAGWGMPPEEALT